MLFLTLFILRLIPFFILTQFQKRLGAFNPTQKRLYIIATSLYIGFVYGSISLAYDYIFKYHHDYIVKYSWYGQHGDIPSWGMHIFLGLIIAVFFLRAIKYKSNNIDEEFAKSALFLSAGLGLVAFLTVSDIGELLLPV